MKRSYSSSHPWDCSSLTLDHRQYTHIVVQLLNRVWLFAVALTTYQTSLPFSIYRSLLKLMSIESVMSSNCLILCHPLLLLPSTFPSIRIFSDELAHCIRWPKYWSFSFSISTSNEYPRLISFSITWFALLAVQETLKNGKDICCSTLTMYRLPWWLNG